MKEKSSRIDSKIWHIVVSIVLLLFISTYIIYKIFFTSYFYVWRVWWELRKIPNIEIVKLTPSVSEPFVITTIMVKNKGEMTFSGWSLKPSQIIGTNSADLGLSKIDTCKVMVIQDISSRNWVILNKEVNPQINNVRSAIDGYDEILAKVKSFPPYFDDIRTPGYYSMCGK